MKKDQLAPDKLAQYELIDRDQRAAERRIADLRDRLRHDHHEVQIARVRKFEILGRRMLNSDRPWEAIKERLVEDERPLTWDEAIDAASCIWKVAMNLDPLPDVKRSVNLADDLKVVNDLIGLAEWPEEKFSP
jgi:hypothetical protein